MQRLDPATEPRTDPREVLGGSGPHPGYLEGLPGTSSRPEFYTEVGEPPREVREPTLIIHRKESPLDTNPSGSRLCQSLTPYGEHAIQIMLAGGGGADQPDNPLAFRRIQLFAPTRVPQVRIVRIDQRPAGREVAFHRARANVIVC